MKKLESSVKYGQIICGILFIFDIILGGIAVFFPYYYAQIFHQNLSNPPIDFIVRTGILWIVFAFFQLMAVIIKEHEKWFFLVGLIRLMEVPADIAYGLLAEGAILTSKLMILAAPIINTIIGIYLLLLSEKIKKERLSKNFKK
ncbi:MAG: hypothetical protein ACTSQJ_12430 [Promethearchaeota archaeon]